MWDQRKILTLEISHCFKVRRLGLGSTLYISYLENLTCFSLDPDPSDRSRCRNKPILTLTIVFDNEIQTPCLTANVLSPIAGTVV